MVWYGVAWRGVIWCGVVWCGVAWCGVAWKGLVWVGSVRCGLGWGGMAWHDIVWNSMVRYTFSDRSKWKPSNLRRKLLFGFLYTRLWLYIYLRVIVLISTLSDINIKDQKLPWCQLCCHWRHRCFIKVNGGTTGENELHDDYRLSMNKSDPVCNI